MAGTEENLHIPYRGASLSHRVQALWYVTTGAWQALLYVIGIGLCLRFQTPEIEKVKEKGSCLFQPIRRQICLVTCTNHMLMDKTWIECTIPVYESGTVKKCILTMENTYYRCWYVPARSLALARSSYTKDKSKACQFARHPF